MSGIDASFDFAACQALMRGGSKTFFAASRLLPARVRDPAIALYAFCRVADDAIDFSDDRATAMMDLNDRLACIYDGRPRPFECDRALAAVVHKFDMPVGLLTALLEGFQWDAEGRRYETLEDLQAYAARVAGSVGAMMAVIMRTRNPVALARACDLGVAMQFTNIARDVGEDARAGRLYLPLQWLRDAGLQPDAWLARPVFDARIAGVIERLLRSADQLYARASFGIAHLPLDCRPAICAAGMVYSEIGRELERAGLDSVNSRAVVSTRRKLMLILRASGTALLPSADTGAQAPALEATRFLVEAAVLEPALASQRIAPRRSLAERARWSAELFERLSLRDQERGYQRISHRSSLGR